MEDLLYTHLSQKNHNDSGVVHNLFFVEPPVPRNRPESLDRFLPSIPFIVPTCGLLQSWMIRTTSSDGMNSHSPSLPRTIIRSSSVSVLSNTSGVDTTPTPHHSLLTAPTLCATVSPSDRDIASPGISWSFSQTRSGPVYPSS